MLQFKEDGDSCYVTGALSQQAVIAHWPQVDSLLSASVRHLDLSAIATSDSAGVALLLHLVAQQHNKGQKLKLVNAPLQLQKLIDLYDLQDFFTEEAQ